MATRAARMVTSEPKSQQQQRTQATTPPLIESRRTMAKQVARKVTSEPNTQQQRRTRATLPPLNEARRNVTILAINHAGSGSVARSSRTANTDLTQGRTQLIRATVPIHPATLRTSPASTTNQIGSVPVALIGRTEST